jgi:hemerythrin
MEWKSEYSVGVTELDDDHKQLISIINRVVQAQDSGNSVQWALQELEAYVQRHFTREEERLTNVNYADFEEHKKEHQGFHDWLRSARITLAAEPEAGFYFGERLKEFLQNWLSHHILTTDMKYKGQIF